MRFPKDFPDKLRSAILVSQVIGKKVKLKLRGKEFQGLCPFHNEKTPSFTVNDQKGFYHCFGCAAHGDVISFVMNNEGLDYPSAVRKLADDFGIPIPQEKFDPALEDKAEAQYRILEKAGGFFEKNLYDAIGFDARNYLKKRGLNSTIAKKFRLGFAPNSYEALINFLKAEGFSDLEIANTGIISKGDRKTYDKFRNRVIFPITDKKNRIIAFGGRSLGEEMPKYLNSAETEIFKKNKTLYNLAGARKSIFDKGFAVAVEGYMDVISLANFGVENVVAGLGTALGAEHLKELFYITDKIVICLDGDEAGLRASKRVSQIALPLISTKKNIFFAFLPSKMDPDDFVKEFGSKELDKLFNQATPLSEALFEFELQELKINKEAKISAENKAKIEANLNTKIAAIPDAALRKHFLSFFKDLLFLLGKNSKKSPTSFGFLGQKIYAKKSPNQGDIFAKNIIALIIKNPDLALFADEFIDVKELHFDSENLNHLKELCVELVENNSKNLLPELEKSGFVSEIEQIKKILSALKNSDSASDFAKFRILLLKDLLAQVDLQYRESLSKIDEIETCETAIINQKIKEIFDYKNSLQKMILSLEKEAI